MQKHNDGHMKFLLTVSTPIIVLAIYMIYWYLLQIEINKTINLPTGLESVGSHEDFAKKKNSEKKPDGIEEEPAPTNPPVDAEAEGEEKPRRFRITKLRNVVLLFTACSLSLIAYLLLVVSAASAWLSLVGLACVIVIALWQQIFEELRRQRLDRIVAIVTLIFLAASFMSLATFANQSLREGEVYQGKARIVGFDYNSYDNTQGDGITRTDLEVAWGGEWGCPMDAGKQCQAFVQGAMCESEKDDEEEEKKDDDGNRKRRRLDGDDEDNNNQDAEEEEVQEEEQEVEEEEAENEDLEEEVEEEEAENEELEDELEEEEDYAEELEEEVDTDYNYYWDDDLVSDSYWDEQDWGNIWGEYACYDLFDYDMSGSEYDADEAPGKDDWPFITIYGNCRTCDAYIVDYFSTEHFQGIQDYKVQGRNYLFLSFVGLIITGILHFKHRMDPIAEKELELLPNDGGAMA
ncbi:expressed unknown protein [Seminavis robusta]|uniref:Uncharacterized protein n=1 Tax=Seminavis robusta TaxID=568900 RepID=A0A9N8H2Q1_9STRA|nr:expressed unknown protein [Seminavis robusta]|eukprot:Sro22_g015510.1 n/a (462) ;mRNA; r:150239-151710